MTLQKAHRRYKWVAEVYTAAIKNGDAPTKAVTEYFGKPRSTAERWVRQARNLGYLNDAEIDSLTLPVTSDEMGQWLKRHPSKTIVARRNQTRIYLIAQTKVTTSGE